MTDKSWKATERAVANLLGGRRVPVSGRGRGDAPDIAHDWLAIEVKHRKRLPKWLREAMCQAKASSGLSRLPIVVLHEAGQRHDEDLVMLALGDFVDWFGQPGIGDDED